MLCDYKGLKPSLCVGREKLVCSDAPFVATSCSESSWAVTFSQILKY